MKTHKLKTWDGFFHEVWDGKKRFELRNNDRNFQVGDTVYLQEYKPDSREYGTGEVRATITYVLKDFIGIEKGYCIFGFKVDQLIERGKPLLINNKSNNHAN